MSTVTYTKTFSFGDTNAGQPVSTQVLGTNRQPLTQLNNLTVTEAGYGQYDDAFVLPIPFTGFVQAVLMGGPKQGAIDRHEVNIFPQAASAINVVIADAVTPILTEIV